MEKLVLINWTDKRATDISNKLSEIQTKSNLAVENFAKEIKHAQSDNNITIPHSFDPTNFKV